MVTDGHTTSNSIKYVTQEKVTFFIVILEYFFTNYRKQISKYFTASYPKKYPKQWKLFHSIFSSIIFMNEKSVPGQRTSNKGHTHTIRTCSDLQFCFGPLSRRTLLQVRPKILL